MNFRILAAAREEADEAAAWYDRKQSGLGGRFLTELDESLESVVAEPVRFPVAEFYTGAEVLRRRTGFRIQSSSFIARRRLSFWRSATDTDVLFIGSIDFESLRHE